jgi:DNA-directed RNA polymerase subunit beta'
VKGLIRTITGTKDGFYNAKLVSKRQDLSARGTAAPDPTLGLDEFSMPEDMAWTTYQPFVIKRLVQRGHSALRARELVENKSSVAREALNAEVSVRPALLNRAPSLHRYNIVASYPKIVPGKTIHVNPFIESGMNLDYDGDALQVHVPASDGAVRDAKKMLLSNNLLGDKTMNELMVLPAHEAIVGLYKGSQPTGGRTKKFKNAFEARQAYARGEIKATDNVELTGGG